MIYDCTQVFNELDLLELRMELLDKYVDYFVISESIETFSGIPKPLYFYDNKERFAKWEHKIIHCICGNLPNVNSFERAAFQKDSIRKSLEKCQPEDIIIYGDVDEIINPDILQHIGDDIYKLEQLNYSYYFNNRSSEVWQGTNVCKYKDLINLNDLRANHDYVVPNAGWHFTNMGGSEQVIKKLEAYDHQEFNKDAIKSSITKKIENNEDYVGRRTDWQGNPFHFWVDESDLPQYLLDNREKYGKYFR